MWQILDTIINDTRINLWYFSHVEPDAAAVLELHPTVSVPYELRMYLRHCRALMPSFRGRDVIPASQKTTDLHLPPLTADLNRSCTDWCIYTAAHHSALPFHSAVEKICLDFTAGADGNLIVNQHCRKSSWTQTPHLKSFTANMSLPTSS